MTRHLHLESIENFRDFGDYPTRHGRRLRKGVLYRSANHHYATPQDLAVVAAIAPAHIVDLRRKDERDLEPSQRWDDFGADVIQNDIGHDLGNVWFEKMRTCPLTPTWFHEDAVDFYRQTPFEERHIDLFTRYFQALAGATGPVVVHCAAGKDRTGLICALTHHVAGVAPDDMIADYLLTNDKARIEARSKHLQGLVKRDTGRDLPMDGAQVAVSVHEDYLAAAFAEIGRQSGSVDGYLEDVIGVDIEMRRALVERLLT